MSEDKNSYFSGEGFPPIDSNTWGSFEESDKKDNNSDVVKSKFTNKLNPNDDVMFSKGFIHSFNVYMKEEKNIYFVRVGLKKGSVLVDGEWKVNFESADLVLGSTLKKLGEVLTLRPDFFKGIMLDMEVRNYRSLPSMYQDKPVVERKGTLETIKIGFLDL